MSIKNKNKVSIVFLQYNSNFNKIKYSLESIISQKNIEFEIIICDDGSANDYFDEIKFFFNTNNFKNFLLIKNSYNVGTVKNALIGLSHSKSRYIKFLSPGDGFNGDSILKEWVDLLDASNNKWSFSLYKCYYGNDDKTLVGIKQYPQYTSIYINSDIKKMKWNYVAYGDNALGAAILVEKETALKYLSIIKNFICLVEDYMYKLMILDDLFPFFYRKEAIIYNYGCGVSTDRNNNLKAIFSNDIISGNKLITRMNYSEKTSKQIARYLTYKNIFMRFIFSSYKICFINIKLIRKFFYKTTNIN